MTNDTYICKLFKQNLYKKHPHPSDTPHSKEIIQNTKMEKRNLTQKPK